MKTILLTGFQGLGCDPGCWMLYILATFSGSTSLFSPTIRSRSTSVSFSPCFDSGNSVRLACLPPVIQSVSPWRMRKTRAEAVVMLELL